MGGMGFEAFFLFGVDGLPLAVGFATSGATFLFLLIFATLGGVAPFVTGSGSSLITEEAALRRADRLEDIAYVLVMTDDNEGTVLCLSDKGPCRLNVQERMASVMERSKECQSRS